MEVTEQLGPTIGSFEGRDIPEYVVTRGRRYNFNRIALTEDGLTDLSQLAPNECVIAPGLIYRCMLIRLPHTGGK